MPDPLNQPCTHVASEAEIARDPEYQACGADAGEPCTWARRWDGVIDPAWHSERLEAAVLAMPVNSPASAAALMEAAKEIDSL